MARDLNGTDQHLIVTSAPVTAVPLTLAAWARPDVATAALSVMAVSNATGFDYWRLALMGNVAGDPLRAQAIDAVGGFGNADTGVGFAAGAWCHCAGVFASNTSRIAYLNGTASSVGTASVNPASADRVTLGATQGSGVLTQYLDGRIAQAAVWNAALTASEITALARGVSPLEIRPTNLVGHWPIYGVSDPEMDHTSGARSLTLVNAPGVADGPPVALAIRRLWVPGWNPPAAGGGVTVTPAHGDSAATAIAPTVILGFLSLSPAHAECVSSALAPTVLLGPVTVAPAFASAASSAIAPTVELSSSSVVPASAQSTSEAVAPGVVLGPMTLTPAHAEVNATAIDPAVQTGGILFTPADAGVISEAVAPTVVLGPVVVAPASASSASSAIAPVVVLGSVVVVPVTADSIAEASDPTVQTPSGVVVAPAHSESSSSAIAPAVIYGSLSLVPNPASSSAATVAPTVVLGPLVLIPAHGISVVSAIAPTVVHGLITLTLPPAQTVGVAVAPSVLTSAVSITPAAAIAVATAADPLITGRPVVKITLRGTLGNIHTLRGSLGGVMLRGSL